MGVSGGGAINLPRLPMHMTDAELPCKRRTATSGKKASSRRRSKPRSMVRTFGVVNVGRKPVTITGASVGAPTWIGGRACPRQCRDRARAIDGSSWSRPPKTSRGASPRPTTTL